MKSVTVGEPRISRSAKQKPRIGRRSQKERSAESRRKLIEAAIQLVHEAGFSQLTITGVARRAGLTTGAVHHHFSSNHELLRGVIDTVYPLFATPIQHIDLKTLSLAQGVDQLIDVYWSVYSRPQFLVIWEIMFGTSESSATRAHMRSLQDETVAQAVGDLVKLFSHLKMSQKLATDLFWYITNQLRGLALLIMFEDVLPAASSLALLKEAVCEHIAKRTARKREIQAKPKSRV